VRIYLVRHGETEWNKEEVFRGRKDIGLSETGKVQAERTGRYFTGRRADRIISSPLKRAIQTAAEINRITGAPMEESAGLIDMCFGEWEGFSLKEVKQLDAGNLSLWQRSPQKLRLKEGERLSSVRRRAAAVLEKLPTGAGDDGALVVVTHRVICKLLILHFLGIPSAHFWDMKFDPCSVTLIEKKPSRTTLVLMNDTCHLKEDGSFRYADF
jgi:phosphoserine phosphatase